MTFDKTLLRNMPDEVGVYLLKDKQNRILYIGKALSLRHRLQTHLLMKKRFPKESLIKKTTENIEFILTNNEAEALILERNLIKQYSPPYNIRFKDDKTYPYLRLTLQEAYPSISITRELPEDGSRYFGPYSDVGSIRRVARYAQKLFRIRNCREKISNSTLLRPCLNYQIDMCSAPCAKKIDKTKYWELINQLCLFLEGKIDNLMDSLKIEMKKQAENLEFEKAKLVRDRMIAIKKSVRRQYFSTEIGGNMDVVGAVISDGKASIHLFLIREGNLVGGDYWIIDVEDQRTTSEIITSFVEQRYFGKETLPSKILISHDLNESKFLEDLFKKNNILTSIITPRTESERELTDLAVKNAEERLQMETRIGKQIPKTLIELKEILGLEEIPMRIEGIDVSNIQGQAAVGSLVTFLQGEIHKSDYRRYKIKTVKDIDDYAMTKEIIRRRYGRIIKEGGFPDLVLIDGGKGHLISVVEELTSLGINIPVIAIAKKEERVFIQGESTPLDLEKYPNVLNLVKRIRDEAHRFAVQYHKKLRAKNAESSLLEEIPGIGRKRKNKLMRRFNSIEELRKASIEEIAKTPSISVFMAKRIQQFFRAVA
jgi:excinuclease ABC subunit C